MNFRIGRETLLALARKMYTRAVLAFLLCLRPRFVIWVASRAHRAMEGTPSTNANSRNSTARMAAQGRLCNRPQSLVPPCACPRAAQTGQQCNKALHIRRAEQHADEQCNFAPRCATHAGA